MIKKIGFLCLTMAFLMACTPDEGKGGKSTIIGKIFVKDYNKEGILKDEYYPGEYPVYIIYGDESNFGDDVKTHVDGSFVFEYLYPGEYTVFAYSKCKTCPGERDTVSRKVVLEHGQVYDLETIEVID